MRDSNRAKVWSVYGRTQAVLRLERGWSQMELARRADVSGGLVAGYELGEKRHPAYEELARVAHALGQGLDPLMAAVYEDAGVSLLEGVEPPEPPYAAPLRGLARQVEELRRELDQRDAGIQRRLAALEGHADAEAT